MKTRRLVGCSLLVVLVLWTSLGWAEQPRYGGTLRIAWPGDPAFFNANQGPAQGAPVTLRYRYPKGPWFDREQSRLDISLNNQWLRSYPLTQQDSATQVRNIFNRFARNEHSLILPPYLLYGASQLQFYFDIKANKDG